MKRPRAAHRILWLVAVMLTSSLLGFLIPACQENPPDSHESELDLRAPVGLTVGFLSEVTVAVEWIDPNDYSTTSRRDVRYEVQVSTDGLRFERASLTTSDSTRTIITRGFAEDSTYHFRVRILTSDAASPFSLVRSLTSPPRVRITLIVTAVSETTMTLNWSPTSAPTVRTIIERKPGTGGSFAPVDTVDGPALSSDVRGPYHVDTAYYFRVQNVSDLQVRSYSDTAVAVLFFNPPYDLHASLLADTAVTLTWKFDNPYAQTIVVEYLHWSGGRYELVADSVNAALLSCTLPGPFIADSREYRFRAWALSSYNRSAYSGAVTIWFSFPAPNGLRITDLSSSFIEFAWNDQTSFESTFELMQSINDSTYTSVGTYPANTSGGVLSIQGDGDLYYRYRIRARSTHNVSTASNAVLVLFDHSSGVWIWYDVP